MGVFNSTWNWDKLAYYTTLAPCQEALREIPSVFGGHMKSL